MRTFKLSAAMALLLVAGCQAVSRTGGRLDSGLTDAGFPCSFDGGHAEVGGPNPENPCQVCASNPPGWSPANEGLSCAPNLACHRGLCEAECVIDGGAYSWGQTNPANLGECCNPSLDPGAWQPFFSKGPNIQLLGPALFPTAADFDGDGKIDLAAISTFDGGVVVVVVHNDGAFANPTLTFDPLPAGAYPQSLVVADLDGDGAPDILVADYSNAIELLHNRGDGTFDPEVVVPLIEGATGVAVVRDLLTPGVLAVVVTTESELFDAGGTALLFEVESDGGFGLVQRDQQTTEPNPWSPCVLPGSMLAPPSVVFETSLTKYNDVEELVVREGAPAIINPGQAPNASINGLAVGDVTGDGIPDLVASNFYETTIGVAPGDEQGGLAPWVRIALPGAPNGPPVLADFDGSGRQAIAVPCNQTIRLLWPTADGGATACDGTAPLNEDNAFPKDLAAADFNGDGAVDLVCSFQDFNFAYSNLQMLFNNCN